MDRILSCRHKQIFTKRCDHLLGQGNQSFAVKLNFLYVRTTRSITCLSGRILRRMLIILALAGLVLGDLAWLTGHEPLA